MYYEMTKDKELFMTYAANVIIAYKKIKSAWELISEVLQDEYMSKKLGKRFVDHINHNVFSGHNTLSDAMITLEKSCYYKHNKSKLLDINLGNYKFAYNGTSYSISQDVHCEFIYVGDSTNLDVKTVNQEVLDNIKNNLSRIEGQIVYWEKLIENYDKYVTKIKEVEDTIYNSLHNIDVIFMPNDIRTTLNRLCCEERYNI